MSVYQGNRNAFPSVTHITQESPSGSSFIKSEPNLKSSDIQGKKCSNTVVVPNTITDPPLTTVFPSSTLIFKFQVSRFLIKVIYSIIPILPFLPLLKSAV